MYNIRIAMFVVQESVTAFSLKHMPTVPIVGVWDRWLTLVGPWVYLNRKLPFVELIP